MKRLKNGQYKLGSKKDAEKAYATMLELQEAISELEKEYSISEMRQDATELKKAADAYLIENGIEHLSISGSDKRAAVIQSYDGIWIETKADLKKHGAPEGTKTLRSIVGKEIWQQITKRVLDPEKLMEAVATGIVDEDEINQAYFEKPRTPYGRIYNDEVE